MSKATKQARAQQFAEDRALATKQARAQQFAEDRALAITQGAASGSTTHRQAVDRLAGKGANLSTAMVDDASIADLQTKLAKEYKQQFMFKLLLGSPWLAEICPDWYVTANNTRDVDGWNKARKKALDLVRDGQFTIKRIPVQLVNGGTEESEAYFVAPPINHGLMTRLVELGNIEMVIACARTFIDDSTVKASMLGTSIADRVAMTGAIREYDPQVYAIILSARNLDKAQAAYDKAQASYDANRLDEKKLARRDAAESKLKTAQAAFDAAWLAVHKIESVAPIVQGVSIPDGFIPVDPTNNDAPDVAYVDGFTYTYNPIVDGGSWVRDTDGKPHKWDQLQEMGTLYGKYSPINA